MKKAQIKKTARTRRHARVRAKIIGTATRPRLSVFRGLRSLYAQLIDDVAKRTIVAAHSKAVKKTEAKDLSGKVAVAYHVGKTIAELAKQKGITKIVFDRGGYRYHGRVAAVAAGARDGGLEF